jgi:hypothetical protein
VRRINVADVWAQPPLTVSGASCALDGEKAEAPSMSRTTPSVSIEQPFWFFSGINGEVPKHSPCSFNLQQVGT